MLIASIEFEIKDTTDIFSSTSYLDSEQISTTKAMITISPSLTFHLYVETYILLKNSIATPHC